jgi:hypothetical protein
MREQSIASPHHLPRTAPSEQSDPETTPTMVTAMLRPRPLLDVQTPLRTTIEFERSER